jgi:PBP1b-binding outer membrane lipoprotein LpoB
MDTGDKTMNRLLTAVLIVLLIGGCVRSEPKRLDEQYGNSVASMIEGQTYNPEAASDTESRPVLSSDSVKAQGNLEAYRRDFPQKTEIQDIRSLGVEQ